MKPPRTVALSNSDLSTMWDDPQPGRAWQDIVAFPRSSELSRTSGAELRLPSGEPILQDKNIWTVDAELADGSDRLVKITHADGPTGVSTMFFDLNTRSMIKIGDSDQVSGAALTVTLADGQLFIDGHASETSQFGYGVWNLRTEHWDFLRSRAEVKKSSIAKLAFFGGHLYITNAGNKFAAIALPSAEPVTSSWGECREILLVRDQDGRYPGPWF